MSYKCSICGKQPKAGNTVSHSHKSSKRLFMPNLQTKKIVLNGKKQRAYVCSICLKSGKAVIAL